MPEKGSGERVPAEYYTTSNLTLKSERVTTTVVGNIMLSRLCIEHTQLTHRYLMSKNDSNKHAQMQHVETND